MKTKDVLWSYVNISRRGAGAGHSGTSAAPPSSGLITRALPGSQSTSTLGEGTRSQGQNPASSGPRRPHPACWWGGAREGGPESQGNSGFRGRARTSPPAPTDLAHGAASLRGPAAVTVLLPAHQQIALKAGSGDPRGPK